MEQKKTSKNIEEQSAQAQTEYTVKLARPLTEEEQKSLEEDMKKAWKHIEEQFENEK